jgi:hypothetical protein
MIVAHDVQQGFERRAGHFDAAIVEVMFRNALLGADDVVHAVGKDIHVLQFGFQHVLGEDDVRVIEEAAEINVHEFLGDAIADAAVQNGFAVVLEVVTFFEVTVAESCATRFPARAD